MAKTVLISINDNEGYAPDQIITELTLAGMLESIQNAIEEFGSDAKVVLSNGQYRGAGFGSFQSYGEELVIGDAQPDEEDEYL